MDVTAFDVQLLEVAHLHSFSPEPAALALLPSQNWRTAPERLDIPWSFQHTFGTHPFYQQAIKGFFS